MPPDDPLLLDDGSVVIDARAKEEYEKWHVPKAMNVVQDWLEPLSDEDVMRVAKTVASSGAQRVVVYGDGDEPDSGMDLAKLLNVAGIKHVFFVTGGAPALLERRKGGKP
jgi:hypothetical protein